MSFLRSRRAVPASHAANNTGPPGMAAMHMLLGK
jgi:hypothetical protein